MKHSIRQRVLDPVTGLKVTKIEQVNGELGSGIVDCNDKEIFESDRVKLGSQVFVVEFTNGHFGLTDDDSDWHDLDLCTHGDIIEHVDDD